MENLLKLFLPEKCVVCSKTGDVICSKCISTFVQSEELCVACFNGSLGGYTHAKCITSTEQNTLPDRFISCFRYEDNVRICIKSSKYGPKYFSVLKKMTNYGITVLEEYKLGLSATGGFAGKSGFISELITGGFIAVPIPMNNKKIRMRGFNQTRIIAEVLAKRLGLRLDENLLNRIRDTKSQYFLTKTQRFNNLKNAFQVPYGARIRLQGKNILLVDDICTSGATFIEAACVLKSSGAGKIYCFALSKKF